MEQRQWNDQKVLVLGTAKSGIAAARYLVSVGAEVTVNDGKTPSERDQAALASLDVKTVYGEHPLALLDGIDLIVKNPGIPYQIDLLQEALRRNIPIWTEVELAYQATDATWIAITGSNGKTTTTTLVHELLKTGSRRVHLAGNIGFPAIEIAGQAKQDDIIVIELSSFQLMGIEQFRPYTAAFLNLSPAHLDYHGDFESYGEAKARIFKNMKEADRLSKCVPVIKQDDAFLRNPAVVTDRYVDEGEIVYGEYLTGEAAKKARETIKAAKTDLKLLDAEINKILWTFTNLFPGCLIKSVEGIRLKKKFFWDQAKTINRHWLAANMNSEAYLGFTAFNTKKITGQDTIDFIEYRRRVAAADAFDVELMAAVLGKPKE